MVLGSSPVTVTSPSDFAPASSKEFLDIQATVECGFTLKRVRDMTRTYSQKTCYMNTDSFLVYIETDDLYKDIAGDVETIFDTSSYELDTPLPKGKNKKSNLD